MIVTVKNLTVSYGVRVLFDRLNFILQSGDFLHIRGANGSGKSTLCAVLAGLAPEACKVEGGAYYDGINIEYMTVAEKCGCCGIIFQNPEKYQFLHTVEDEFAFAMENLCVQRNGMERRIAGILSDLGIEHLLKRRINSLSGGEKQLTAIASVLVMSPKMLICDEITAALDDNKRESVLRMLVSFANGGGIVVLVSHDDTAEANKIIQL